MPRSTLLRCGLVLATISGCRTPQPGVSIVTGGDGGHTTPAGPALGRFGGQPQAVGFGAAVAASSDGIWISAPHGDTAQVYGWAEDGPVLRTEAAARAGTTLAAGPDGPWIGAPLLDGGQVLGPAGSTLALGPAALGIGLVGGTGWAAAHATGWLDSEGRGQEDAPGRPTSIARDDGGNVALGMALGKICLQAGTDTLKRPEARDQAGFALAAGDVDGDGHWEWIVGAPGSNKVHLVDPDSMDIKHSLSGPEGRFGAALSVADLDGDGVHELLVGAPMAGSHAQGAAWLFALGELDDAHQEWVGQETGEQLGFALGLYAHGEHGRVVLGAPGLGGQGGLAWVDQPALLAPR